MRLDLIDAPQCRCYHLLDLRLLGLQQASLSLSSVVTPVAFAAIVAATSWGVGFGVAAAAALAGTITLRGLGEG